MANRVAAAARRMFIGHTTLVAYLALLLASSSAVYAASIGSADVIDNSLQSVDLKDGAAVKGVDIVNDSVAGADVNEVTLAGVARKLMYSSDSSSSASKTNLLTVAGYTFKARCQVDLGLSLELFVNGPAGDYQGYLWWSPNDSNVSSSALPQPRGEFIADSTDTLLFPVAIGGGYYRGSGEVWIHSGTTLLEVSVHALVDARTLPYHCLIYGTITKAV
jgi:hypothetical protein